MATPNIWSGVKVNMQDSIGTTANITAISKASEAVCTATNTLANGDYVLLLIQGMVQLDLMVARVKAVSGTNFTLDGIDSTLFDTFASGTFQKITMATSITSATDVNASGGDPSQIDATTIHDTTAKNIPGIFSAAKFDMQLIWDASDTAFKAVKAASDIKGLRAFLFTFATGQKAVFYGYVAASGLPTGGSQALVKTAVTVTMFGKPNYYAT